MEWQALEPSKVDSSIQSPAPPLPPSETAAFAPASTILHPPVMPGALMPRRTSWPTVLGVIGLIFGIAGFFGGLAGLIAPLLMDHFMIPQPGSKSFDAFAGIATWRPWLIANSLVTAGVAGWLALAAAMLMARRRAGRSMVIGWAVAKMLLVVGTSFLSYQVQQAQFQAMQQSGTAPPMVAAMMAVGGVIGVAIAIIWGWALPVFMLIWCVRPAIRREVQTWP